MKTATMQYGTAINGIAITTVKAMIVTTRVIIKILIATTNNNNNHKKRQQQYIISAHHLHATTNIYESQKSVVTSLHPSLLSSLGESECKV